MPLFKDLAFVAVFFKPFKIKTMRNNIYERAYINGCFFETACVGISIYEWEDLMRGHTKANRKEVVKIALLSGVIDKDQAKEEIKKPHFNPYTHFKTKSHIIYVHSGIEHFIRIN